MEQCCVLYLASILVHGAYRRFELSAPSVFEH